MGEGRALSLTDLPEVAALTIWISLDWQTVAACRTSSSRLQREVGCALLSRAQEYGDDAHLPALLFHPAPREPRSSVRGAPLLEVIGQAEAFKAAPVLGLWRLAASQTRPSQRVLAEIADARGISVPKAGVLHRFLQLPLLRTTQRLRLVQEFMSMCLISQTVRGGNGPKAGMFRALSVAYRNFFACVDLTQQATLVVGDIPSEDPRRLDPSRLSEIWLHILRLAAEELPTLPGCRADCTDAPVVQCGPFVQQGPLEEFKVSDDESCAFIAGIVLTCRALRDYLSSLRIARLCKTKARTLFQGGNFSQALAFYRIAQWHCPQGDSTLFSNAALCCLRLSRPQAAVEHALNALFLDETNPKAALALVKAELCLGYSGCNGWQDEAVEKIASSNKTLAELRKDHRRLMAPRRKALLDEFGLGDPRDVPLEAVPLVEARLLQLLAEEEEGEPGDPELRSRLLTCALARGSEAVLIPAAEALVCQQPPGSERFRAGSEVLALLASSPLLANMEAALALGRVAPDSEVAFLHLATAAASQDPAVLEAAGDELVQQILAQNGGRWKTGSPYGTWLMAYGGQGNHITELMQQSYHIDQEVAANNGPVTTFRPRQ